MAIEDIRQINDRVKKESIFVTEIFQELGKVIVGQDYILQRMMVGLLTNGHILIEGVPGLAKTLASKTLAAVIKADFKRIQFTPDLLPADLIGTTVYNPVQGSFSVKKGPLFANIILADEINRAPAKVQSALLEAMQEYQVTIGEQTYQLPEPFLVLATQNPIEQEGTYPLPEAQVDRFMLKLKITYPDKNEERQILDRMSPGQEIKVNPVINLDEIRRAREVVRQIYIDEKVKNYIVDIVLATRNPAEYNLKELSSLLAYGASPRATIYLTQAARAIAFLDGRGYVTPDDVKTVGPDILRHRLILTYEAEAEEINSENIIQQIFDGVEVP